MGDLNRRRGKIQGMDTRGTTAILRAEVPLSEMFGYSTAIRTLSSGRASYSMQPARFEQVPQQIVEQIVEQRGTKN
jgi:elongation factor G